MRRSLLLLAVCLLFTSSASAQQFTGPEKEVVDAVEACYSQLVAHAMEAWLACFHEEYSLLYPPDVAPLDKDFVRTSSQHWFSMAARYAYLDVRPIAVKVHDDAALIHYFTRLLTVEPDGEDQESRFLVSLMLVKEGGRWLFAGGSGYVPNQ